MLERFRDFYEQRRLLERERVHRNEFFENDFINAEAVDARRTLNRHDGEDFRIEQARRCVDLRRGCSGRRQCKREEREGNWAHRYSVDRFHAIYAVRNRPSSAEGRGTAAPGLTIPRQEQPPAPCPQAALVLVACLDILFEIFH